MKPLTEPQAAVLAYIVQFFLENHELPPLRVMAEHFGWRSKNAGRGHMVALLRKGRLERNAIGNLRLASAVFTVQVSAPAAVMIWEGQA